MWVNNIFEVKKSVVSSLH